MPRPGSPHTCATSPTRAAHPPEGQAVLDVDGAAISGSGMIVRQAVGLSAACGGVAASLAVASFGPGVLAVKILSRTGALARFRSPAVFASLAGVAPIDVSSGDVQRTACPASVTATQLCPTRHGHHPDPARHRRARLLPGQTCRREVLKGSTSLPEPPTCRRRLPGQNGPVRRPHVGLA
ncbi:transposase [Dactylosporangium sp. NBC_01737]|uniref:transposase n=1 Tax=Dactylosporangium sp. NBC_01737 TaxID=2975959 RepID=UPI003FA39483